jgi:hypothetical protein
MRQTRPLAPIPNWSLIRRYEGDPDRYISDEVFLERWNHMHLGSPSQRFKMVQSLNRRKLIPPSVWEELVDWSILKAICEWKGNGDGRCPLVNYTWQPA